MPAATRGHIASVIYERTNGNDISHSLSYLTLSLKKKSNSFLPSICLLFSLLIEN